MARSCVYTPSRGKKLFSDLRKSYDYYTAKDIFLRSINPNFINDFKSSLELDEEGVPTIDSVLNNSFMKKYLGREKIMTAIQSKFKTVKDTRDNYNTLLSDAYDFNKNNQQNKSFVAIVENVDDDNIRVVIKPRTQENLDKFKNQYATKQLNDKLLNILSPIGVTINNLTEAEVKAGRVGVTDFTSARNIGTSLISVIRVANNREGEQSISEEFSHLVIGTYRNEPLIQRAIALLEKTPEVIQQILGYETFDDVMEFYDNNISLAAEEALGHILQENLLKHQNGNTISLLDRLFNWVKNKFKNIDDNEVVDAINEVDEIMSNFASDILSGTKQITQEDVKESQRDAVFNALSDRIERNIKILKESVNTEIKRYKIQQKSISKSEDAAEKAKGIIEKVSKFTQKDADTIVGIFEYANTALEALRSLDVQFKGFDLMTPKQKFGFLRSCKMYIDSYGVFLKQVQDAIIEEETEGDDDMFLRDFTLPNNTVVSVKDVVKELVNMSDKLNRKFIKTATPAFVEFLKPIMGEKIVIPFGKKAGQEMSLEELILKSPEDISFIDRWLQSMSDSGDLLLQGFDSALKKQNTKTRLEAIDFINKIQAFRKRAEQDGIKTWDFIFEKDRDGNKTGYYLSEINVGQFEKDLADFLEDLDSRYGKNPNGEEAKKKLAEKSEWMNTHAVTLFGNPMPNPKMYRNKDYDNLSQTELQYLKEYLELKDGLDHYLPDNRVSILKAIQVRKNNAERFWESISSPTSIVNNMKELIDSTFLDKEDDDSIFGERTKAGLTSFDGNEFMTLPALYTTKLKNPNELSTDAIGALIVYAYSSIQYKNTEEILDALELGRSLMSSRETVETRGGKKVVERINAFGNRINREAMKSTNMWEQKLNDWFEQQVYHRYLKDQGSFTLPVPKLKDGKLEFENKEINKNKFTSFVLKQSSLAQLGFNFLANIANVNTGLAMTNIEAAAGQFFNAKELFLADKEYASELHLIAAEASQRTKTSKVGLFYDLLDVKQNYGQRTNRMQTRNWLKRIFGEDIAFIGQEIGDHWLYSRVAIAMAMRKMVLYKGEEMSLWDALQVEDYKEDSSIKQLNIKDIQELDGSALDLDQISRKIAKINHKLFGIYNDEDANAASRVILGRLLQQYRKWMTIQYSDRFRSGYYDLATERYKEGYYRTMGRYMKQVMRGGFQFVAQYKNMTEDEQANIKRAIYELVSFFALWAIINFIDWPDDKDRPWAMKMAEYASNRLLHEKGTLTPLLIPGAMIMPQEILKTLGSPIPSASVFRSWFDLINSAAMPSKWNNEIQSGPYKGMSTVEKNFMKAPFWGVNQYKQINRFTGELDNSIKYLTRPY